MMHQHQQLPSQQSILSKLIQQPTAASISSQRYLSAKRGASSQNLNSNISNINSYLVQMQIQPSQRLSITKSLNTRQQGAKTHQNSLNSTPSRYAQKMANQQPLAAMRQSTTAQGFRRKNSSNTPLRQNHRGGLFGSDAQGSKLFNLIQGTLY